MEHKRDIGDLLQKKLEGGTRIPEDSLWERLDESLKAQTKKRRTALWYLSGGLGMGTVLLFFLIALFSNPQNADSNQGGENGGPLLEAEPVVTNQHNDLNDEDLKNPSMSEGLEEFTQKNTTSEIVTDNREATSANTRRNNKSTILSQPINKDSMQDKGFSKKTNYLYYNSDLGGTISGSKEMIDSIVKVNEKKMAIRDSIARKRAIDSIKLNQRSKDSM